jgi:hypothetical protein
MLRQISSLGLIIERGTRWAGAQGLLYTVCSGRSPSALSGMQQTRPTSSPALEMEHLMINWPNMLHDMEHWADGFLTGAAATSLIAIAGVAIVLLARAM